MIIKVLQWASTNLLFYFILYDLVGNKEVAFIALILWFHCLYDNRSFSRWIKISPYMDDVMSLLSTPEASELCLKHPSLNCSRKKGTSHILNLLHQCFISSIFLGKARITLERATCFSGISQALVGSQLFTFHFQSFLENSSKKCAFKKVLHSSLLSALWKSLSSTDMRCVAVRGCASVLFSDNWNNDFLNITNMTLFIICWTAQMQSTTWVTRLCAAYSNYQHSISVMKGCIFCVRSATC